MGADIDGEAVNDYSGHSVSISSDGTRVAIGAGKTTAPAQMTPATCACTRRAAGRGPRWATTSTARLRATTPGTRYRCPRTARAWRSALPAGHVRVYEESGGTWTQVGDDIDGEAAGDYSGDSVSMSSDGTRVAIGAPATTAPALRPARARVRRERRDVDPGGRRHRRRGCDVLGHPGSLYRCPRTGRAWRSALLTKATATNAGHVCVYAESGGTWTQVGDDIDGEAANDYSGDSVSMSSDGTRVAIGAVRNRQTWGHVRCLRESGGTWTQVGDDINGEAADDRLLGTRCRCPRTARAWRSALSKRGRAGCSTPVTCACTRRAAGRGPRWAMTSTARLRERLFRVVGIDVLGRHARSDRRSQERRHRAFTTLATCGCSAYLAMHLLLPQMGLLATALTSWRADRHASPRATRGT